MAPEATVREGRFGGITRTSLDRARLSVVHSR